MLAKSSFFIKHKKILIASSIILLLGICLLLIFKSGSKSTYAITRETYVVKSGDISTSITGSGTIASSNEKTISSEVAADVLSVNVSVGDEVSKGDVLFELDTATLDSQVRSQQKNVNSLLKEVNSYVEDIENLTVYATSSGYVSNLNSKVGDDVSKNSTLFTLSNDDYYYLSCYFYYNSSANLKVGDTAKVLIADNLAEFDGTVSFVSDYKTISEEGIPVQEVEIKIPNPGYTLAGFSARGTIYTGTLTLVSSSFSEIKEGSPMSFKLLSSGTIETLNVKNGDYINAGEIVATLSNDDLYENLEDAKESYNNAYEDLLDTKEMYDFYTITAPIDGIITSLNVDAGDYVREEASLATLVNNQNLEFMIDVDELEILDVSLGQEVEITIDALSETSINPIIGYVSEIAYEGTYSNSVTTYPVTVSFSGDENIKIGFNSSATILTSHVENVLVVPVEAISSRKGSYFVTMVDGTEKEISVGLYNEDYIEVTEGLEVGDTILLPEKVTSTSTETSKDQTEASFNFGGGMPGGNMGGGMPGGNMGVAPGGR